MSGNSAVNPDLVRRVVEASIRLNYTANPLARALRTKQTDTIGMVVPSISNPYFVGAVEAVERVLADSGRALILCDSRDDVDTEAARIDLLLQRRVDGLIVIPVSAKDSVTALSAATAQVAVVQFDRVADFAGTDFVGSDSRDGMRQCIEHLREQGSRTFAYIGARPLSSTAAERARAFQDLVPEEDRHADWELLGDFSLQWGVSAARRLLAGATMPGAILCGADVIAVAVLGTLRVAGVEIPQHVRLAGYDNSELGRVTVPPVTSVSQPIDAMAREAVRLLDHRRQDGFTPLRKSIFAPTLVIRESTTVTEMAIAAAAEGTANARAL